MNLLSLLAIACGVWAIIATVAARNAHSRARNVLAHMDARHDLIAEIEALEAYCASLESQLSFTRAAIAGTMLHGGTVAHETHLVLGTKGRGMP